MPAMTLVVRGSGRSWPDALGVAGDGLVLHPPVGRPGAVDRDDVQPGGEAALPVPGADLGGDVEQRLLAGVLGVAGVGQHAAADVERARPDRAEQGLQRVAVAVAGAAREVVDVVRRERRAVGVPRGDHPCNDNAGVSAPSRLGRYPVRRRHRRRARSRPSGWPTTSSSTRRSRSRCWPTTGPRTSTSGSASSRRGASCARSSRRTWSASTTPASWPTGGRSW